jgi:hypothetical protein
MNEQQDSTQSVSNVNPLMQAIEWEGKTYFTSRYFHQNYITGRMEAGQKVTHARHDNFFRVIQSMPIYHILVQRQDIVELYWKSLKDKPLPHVLRKAFEAVHYNRLVLINDIGQVELSHHLDDNTSKAMAYTHNQQAVKTKSPVLATESPVHAYPELKAIIELVESVAQTRQIADAAKIAAAKAEAKADLAMALQPWLTLREYAYLHKLGAQFPESQWGTFGRYLTGYCQEHNIPVRAQGVAGRQYPAENAYHVEVIAQLLPPWLKQQAAQPYLREVK